MFSISEQQYFEVEKRFADSQDRFVAQTQELRRLKEDFAKNGKCDNTGTQDKVNCFQRDLTPAPSVCRRRAEMRARKEKRIRRFSDEIGIPTGKWSEE